MNENFIGPITVDQTVEITITQLANIATTQQARVDIEFAFKGLDYNFLAKTTQLKDIMQAVDDLWGGVAQKESELITSAKDALVLQDEEISGSMTGGQASE